MFRSRKKNQRSVLDGFSKLQFGPYLAFIETVVFNTEVLKKRFKDLQGEIDQKKTKSRQLLLFYSFSNCICPVFLIIVLYPELSAMDILFILTWLIAGVFLVKKEIRVFKEANIVKKESHLFLNQAMEYSLVYINDMLETFFDNSEVMKNSTKPIPEKEFMKLKHWLFELEMDLTLFDEISYRYNTLNTENILRNDDLTEDRFFSKNFIFEYISTTGDELGFPRKRDCS